MSHDKVNKYMFEKVTQMLKDYKDLKQKALQLEFEINNYIPAATGEDMIDTMTFNRALGEGIGSIHSGQASDKTANIAISYAEKVDKLNIRHKQELETELRISQTEILRIEYYISILDEKFSTVLRMLYIEGLSFAEASKKANMSVTAINNTRRTGIMKLVKMFNLITN